jgi:hypothetical protein
LSIPSVPFLGTNTQKLKKEGKFVNEFTQSLFIGDDHIANHVRYFALTKNIN